MELDQTKHSNRAIATINVIVSTINVCAMVFVVGYMMPNVLAIGETTARGKQVALESKQLTEENTKMLERNAGFLDRNFARIQKVHDSLDVFIKVDKSLHDECMAAHKETHKLLGTMIKLLDKK